MEKELEKIEAEYKELEDARLLIVSCGKFVIKTIMLILMIMWLTGL